MAAFAFAAFPAQAADMYAPGVSAKDAPIYYEAIPNWTGFYLGVNGGYGWGAQSSTLYTSAWDDVPPTVLAAASSKLSTQGGFGGGQLGYNAQRDRIVFGVEADIQGANIGGKAFSEANADLGEVVTGAWAKSSLGWFGTLRGRVGYSFGSTLLYATGGFAFGGVTDSLSQVVTSLNPATPTILSDSVSKNTTATGWAVGGGLETALTPSWSVKAEYQYIDLGSTLLSTNNDIPYTIHTDNGNASINIDHTYHTVRLGLNYKFNQPYEPLK